MAYSADRQNRGVLDSLALALEPRFMYDAAGAATAATVAEAAKPSTQDQAAAAPDQSKALDHSDSGDAASLPGDRTGVSEVPPPADVASGGRPSEIVFVDSRLPDLQALPLRDGVEIVLLDPARDGIAQVSEALAGRQGVAAVHFFSHGEGGSFTLGQTRVDAATLSQEAATIAGWRSALSADADIMIWGCDVASQPSGEALLSSISLLTGADVAASTDLTGIAAKGGDWTLEVSKGTINAATPFQASALEAWDHLLDPPAIAGADKLTVVEPSSINLPGADRSSLTAWQFQSTAGDPVTVTATISDSTVGTLANGSGLGTAITGGWSFTGTLAAANNWLDSITFVAADVERGNGGAQATITLGIADGSGGSASQDIAVEVTPSNDPTVLSDTTTAVVEGSTRTLDLSVLPALDPEVTALTQVPSQIVYRLTADPAYGYLTLNGQRIGSGSIFTQKDVIDGNLSYVHTATGADQNTDDSFSVSVNDGATPQALSDTATVTLAITAVNQAPTVSGSGSVYEGQPANAVDGGVPQSAVGNFISATGGGDPGDNTLTVEITDLPDHGQLYFDGAAVGVGFTFLYAERGRLTYSNDGIDIAGRPPNDSFGVKVTDGGGGTGTPLNTTATIDINVRPVNDDPTLVVSSTLNATVPPPAGVPATDYKVTLTPAMLNVTDIDSAPENITFVVTSQTALDQGRLIFDNGGGPALLPEGGTFTLADILAGRVQYWQMEGASPGQTDVFNFQVVDNAVAPHWNADGTSFERLGGIYTGPTQADMLRTFAFTINLAVTPDGADDSGLPERVTTTTSSTSNHAGTDTGGVTYGTLLEGDAVILTNGSGGQPGLSYGADGVEPSQVVYSILGFGGAGPEWNGELQKLVGGSWIRLDVFDTFTQADLDAGLVRFQHDGGEDFESSVTLRATAGVLVDDGLGGLTMDQWNTDFFFYVKPVNDAPTASGSSSNILDEGATVGITRDMLSFSDADDAISESYLEAMPALPGGEDNYAVNHDGASPLTFTVTAPLHGRLEYRDNGGDWHVVTGGMEIDASWLTNDPTTTRLRYTHDGTEARTDGFTAIATDRWGATSNIATVDFVVTNLNDAPQIASAPDQSDPHGPLPGGDGSDADGANEPLHIIYEGSYSAITPAMLQAVDPDSSAEQVQYRITSAPAHGRIAYSTDGVNFVTIGVGSSFSQADVALGNIYYLSDGTDPVSAGYPSTPDDKFVFTLADGAAEQTGREFWVYLKPTNDAPVVTAPSGPIPVTDNLTSVPGFSVADPDLTSVNPAQEVDFIEVVVRLLDKDGDPLASGDYADVDISVTAGGATIDSNHDGNGDYLVLRGTRDSINSALSTLQVSFGTNRDEIFQVEVIADDRVRDASGNLLDRDPGTAGSQPGGNGGGTLNQPETTQTGDVTAVLDTSYDWYNDAVPTAGLIVGNISAARVTIWASSENDPATLGSTNDAATTYEDQATPIGAAIDFQIADPESTAFGSPVTVTLSVPTGTLNVGTNPNVAVIGGNTGSLQLTGTVAEIQALLNASLTYRSASNDNADSNGGQDGDVTLTVTFSDNGSNFGDGQSADNPAPLEIALTIVPVNDAPTVSAGTGTIVASGQTLVPGFSVGDVDLSDGTATGESDFISVTIRLTDAAGNPLSGAQHGEVAFSSTSVPGGLTFDSTYDGTGSALVIYGTQAQVNAYLAGLRVELSGTLANSDNSYKVEVVADDRMRDASGALIGGANGGLNNNAGSGTVAVPTTAIDPYADVPGGLTANVSSNARDLFPSATNDAAEIEISADPVRNESSGTVQLSGISVTDSDALDGELTVTVTLPSGFTIASIDHPSSGVGTDSVTITGTLDEINAALNSIRIQLPDAAGAPLASDWNGSFDVTIVVNDNGHNGERPGSLDDDTNLPGSNPGDFDYADGSTAALVTTRVFTVTVTPVNDAPQVINGASEILPSSAEDGSPTVETVDTLFGDHFSDPVDQIPGGSSSNSFAGVAIVGLTPNSAQGVWQYYDGASWVAIGNRTAANALVLAAGTPVRFFPAANFHGTPNQMTVRLIETGDGGNASTPPATGAVIDLSGGGATGQTTRYSAGTVVLSTDVTNVNDRPTLGNGTLPPVAEDTALPPGRSVATLFGSTYGDVTDNQAGVIGGDNAASPLGGIAIVGNAATAAEGAWQYSIDGGASWTDIPPVVSDMSALLLPTNAQLRFVPAPNFNGDPGALTVRGADTPVTFAASSDISGTVASQTSTWSTTHTLTTVVTPLNDAPVLVGTASSPTVVENFQTGTGDSVPPTRLVEAGTVDLSDIDLATTDELGSGVFGAGAITVDLGASYRPGDVLFVDGILPAGVSASNNPDHTLTISFDADTTVDEVEALIEQIAFRHTGDNPTDFGAHPTRDYTITVTDGNNVQPGGNAGGPVSMAAAPISGTLTITARNDPPSAVNDVNSIAENTASVGGDVIAGGSGGAGQDSDPDSSVLTVVDVSFGGVQGSVGSPLESSYGTLTLNADGTYTFALDNSNPAVNALKVGDTLTEVFTYTIDDGSGGTDTATLIITITGVTDGSPAIAAVDGNGGAGGEADVHESGLGDPSTSETTTGTIDITAPDGLDSIEIGGTSISLAELANLSTVPVVIDTGEGTLTVTGFTPTSTVGGVPTSGTLTYSYTLNAAQSTPGADQSIDTIALQVSDAGGGTAPGTLMVRIVDDAPVANLDSVEIGENAVSATVSGNVVTGSGAPGNAADDIGADGPSASGTVTAVSFGATAGPVGTALDGSYGSLTLNADGSYSYVLDSTNPVVEALAPGQTLTEVYSYTITDSDGDTATTTLTITIVGENDDPVAVDDTNAIVENTASVSGNVNPGDPGQDSDPDSSVLTVTGVSFGGDPQTIGTPFASSYGTLTLNPDGTYTFDLDNNNPVVNGLKAGDPPLTEVFTYTISDGSGGSATATLTITITGVSDGSGPSIAPVDTNGGADGEADVHENGLGDPSTSETTTGTIDIIAPDGLDSIEIGGTTISLAQLENLATVPVVIDTGKGLVTLTGFTPTATAGVPISGILTYSYTLTTAQSTPGADQSIDTITLGVSDAGGGTATGTLAVRIVDDAPVANLDSVEIGENTVGATISGNVVTGSGAPGSAADDVGADGPSASGPVTAVSFGATAGTVGTALDGSYGSLTLNADGSYSYVLDSTNPVVEALAPGQTLTEIYTYTITDGDGDTATTTLTITIIGENDAPVVVGGGSSISGVEDGVIVLDLSDFPSTDVDAGDAIETVRIEQPPGLGTLYLDGVALPAGSVISVADIAAGKLTYRPAPDGNGSSYDSFGYQLGDGTSFSATGTMNIDIAPRNDTPTVAGPANVTATEDVPLAFDGGSDADHAPNIKIDDLVDLSQTGATDLFTVTLTVGHGTLTIADPEGTLTGEGTGTSLSLTGTRDALNAALETLTYLADANYSGADQLVIGLDDHINAGTGPGAEPGGASHVVDILVRGQGDAPVLSANPVRGTEDSWVPLAIDVASADLSDPETVGLDLTGLPAGWSIRVGTGEAVVSTGSGQVFSFTASDLAAGLAIMAPANVNSREGQSVTLGLAATSSDGASTATTRGQLVVTVDPVNDRPVASGQVVLPTISNVDTGGGTVADLFGGHYIDVTDDASVSHGAERDTPLAGIAIIGNEATASQGAWQYDLGDGGGWRVIPASGLGDHSALILPANAQLRFVPVAGFSGEPGGLVVRLSDGTGFPAASASPEALVDLTSTATGALGHEAGGWSQQTVPVSIAVSNALGDTQAAFMDLPGYDRWGTTYHQRELFEEQREGVLAYLEGRPVDRYTVAWQPISQQMIFRWSGGLTEGKLSYEAGLGRNEPLPSWITFNATMQTVTAMPDHDVKPGIYVVRVIARDTAGHEAASALTIHVLHDNAKSLEEIRRRAQGDQPRLGAPPSLGEAPRENGLNGQAESPKPEADTAARNAPNEARAPDAGIAANHTVEARSASLTRSLIAFGPAGQMIEAARFLEALTLDDRSGH